MLLFNGTDGIQRSEPINTGAAYITLSGGAGDQLENTIVGSAPATAISIEQNIDIDTHKAFDGNYTIGVFGHSLSTIIIDGLDLYTDYISDCVSGSDIQTWWNAWNVEDNPSGRIILGISCRGTSTTFTCVATD